MYIILNFIY